MALICDICRIRPADARVSLVYEGRMRIIDVCRQDYLQLQANHNLSQLPEWEELQASEENADGYLVGGEGLEAFSVPAQEAFKRAAMRASEYHSQLLDTEHLLLALLDVDTVKEIIERAGIRPGELRAHIAATAERGVGEPETITPSYQVRLVSERALSLSRDLNQPKIGPEHLLVALADREGLAGDILRMYGAASATLQEKLVEEAGKKAVPKGKPSLPTPQLDKYSRDLTDLARQHRLDPVIGRTTEIETTVEVLSRRTKNNPVLIGEPGVGKTAIVEGLAQRIVSGDVPESLQEKRVVELSLNSLVSGTKYRGEFEERLKNVLEEIQAHRDEVLVFVDELHTVVGTGNGEGGLDVANVLKPSLARGELHLIGATTLKEYQRHIERDSALERRFQPVVVGEPTIEQADTIIEGLKRRYEEYHHVNISSEAVKAAVRLSQRYVPERYLPDKAIDLIDQTSARIKISQKRPDKTVQAADIAFTVARLTGIPLQELTEKERSKLLKLEQRLEERIIGQKEAVSAVASAIRVSRAGLSKPHSPIATFLFLGPTGVGKTETAKAVAELLFSGEDSLIRIDMSEYMERHTTARLVGSPPGYVGHEEGGQLTEKVRRRPYSVLLLDEIEKAHPEAHNLLLQILDDGRLTDGKGRVVDFSNTVIIATSNLGSGFGTSAPIGFQAGDSIRSKEDRERVLGAVKSHFRPEFINRLDEIVVFNTLANAEIESIVSLQARQLAGRLAEQEVGLDISKAAIRRLAEIGYSQEYGAREVRRALKQEVELPISRLLLEGSLKPGDRVRVERSQNGEIRLAVS